MGNVNSIKGPDSRARIQAAIDTVAAMKPGADGFRGTVFLKKGDYYLNGGLIMKSGVVLRGEGQRGWGSMLIFRNPKKPAITIGSCWCINPLMTPLRLRRSPSGRTRAAACAPAR